MLLYEYNDIVFLQNNNILSVSTHQVFLLLQSIKIMQIVIEFDHIEEDIRVFYKKIKLKIILE